MKSIEMKEACQNLTNSRVTKREIGTKLQNIKIQVPVFLIQSKPNLVFQGSSGPSVAFNPRYVALSPYSTAQADPMAAETMEMSMSAIKMKMTYMLVFFMILDDLYFALALFI